ncbi:MAG: ABC transporter permease subunit, partial [Flavobacteriales bacterium]|nr:ABC transporter permease subunit [Flavobacteriales bacterium]
SFFDSLIAFILLVVFLGVSGIFTWMLGSDVFLRGQADLQAFFGIAYWALYLFVPALTMRTLAEERRSGTLDLLLSRSVSDWQVVLGKFWASLLLIAIALACTLPYYLTVAWLGDLDHGAAWSGYLALFLLGAAYVSIGVYAS